MHYFLKLFFKRSLFKLIKDNFKLMVVTLTIKIINQQFHLINFKSALTAGFCLEFHNSSTLRTQPPFTVLCHHAPYACGLDSFGAVKCIQIMPFDILFGVLFHQWAWKLAASSAIAEIFGIKTGFNFTFQTGLAFTVIAYQTSRTWILVFFTADAVDPAGCK